MTQPKQKRGRSKQDYETPPDFIAAVEERFGPLSVDLAARKDNAKVKLYVSPEENSLSVLWTQRFPRCNLWLNPPFSDIGPWAEKCARETKEARARREWTTILFLTPASIGSDWFADHVHQKALVLGLRPRLKFVGMKPNPKTGKVDGYPKDLMLSVFGLPPGFDTWRWK